MKILIVSGSQRKGSKSAELAHAIKENVISGMENVESSVLDLSTYPYLLDHYSHSRDNDAALQSSKEQVLAELYGCDGIVVVSPEWGGMLPPALVNLFLLTANGSAGGLPLGHKPAFAVGVSASGGGSNPVSLMKAYTAKNSHLVWLPLHAIIQNVEDFLSHAWTPTPRGRITQVQSRIEVGLESLLIYAKTLSGVRDELVTLSKVHPFGQ
ncbi:NAD(P)H-dependent oxidoreductase [Thalassotalea fusca]